MLVIVAWKAFVFISFICKNFIEQTVSKLVRTDFMYMLKWLIGDLKSWCVIIHKKSLLWVSVSLLLETHIQVYYHKSQIVRDTTLPSCFVLIIQYPLTCIAETPHRHSTVAFLFGSSFLSLSLHIASLQMVAHFIGEFSPAAEKEKKPYL